MGHSHRMISIPSVKDLATAIEAHLGQSSSDGSTDDNIVVRVDEQLGSAYRRDGSSDGLKGGSHFDRSYLVDRWRCFEITVMS
jgi:cell wall-associated NlpC family hydrolase